MKLKNLILVLLFCLVYTFSSAHSSKGLKKMIEAGRYTKALPLAKHEFMLRKADPERNYYYALCLYKTNHDLDRAETCFQLAAKHKFKLAFYYLGLLYTPQYRFTEAEDAFQAYENALSKKETRALADLQPIKARTERLHRMATNTEDIQFIDSVVVDKDAFLSAIRLSPGAGNLDYAKNIFKQVPPSMAYSVVYSNQKQDRFIFDKQVNPHLQTLFSVHRLLNGGYSTERQLSDTNFGLKGTIANPYLMPDGVTIYFAAKDSDSIGGYDLFISRYDLNNDTYLKPERLNMPFNSIYNDYMLVEDDTKGVGWLVSDRFQPQGKVCVYTFIPNSQVTLVNSTNMHYLANRAQISSIRDSWHHGANYSVLKLRAARITKITSSKSNHDFTFVINDAHTYYSFSDFKSKQARDAYFNYIQAKSQYDEDCKTLGSLRSQYHAGNKQKKDAVRDRILNLEAKLDSVRVQLPQQEMKVRNMEILYLTAPSHSAKPAVK